MISFRVSKFSWQTVLIVQIDDPTPPEQLKCTVRTFVRPLDKFPPNFEKRAKDNAKGSILPMQNERMLLNSLLSELASYVDNLSSSDPT